MLIRRIGVCFLILILSVPALMLYSILMYILLNPSNPIHYHWMNYLSLFGGAIAWLKLLIMATVWINQKRISKLLSVSGGLCSVWGVTPFVVKQDPIVFLALPGFIFALYLCYLSWQENQ